MLVKEEEEKEININQTNTHTQTNSQTKSNVRHCRLPLLTPSVQWTR